MARQAPDLGRERCQQRPPQLGLRVDEAEEGVPSENEGLGRLDGDDRRRVGRAVEEGELAEELARPEDGDDGRLRTLAGWQDDLDLARGDDEQRIPWIALVEDGLGLPKAPDPEGSGESIEARIVGVPEQPACPERVPRHRPAGSRHLPPL